MSVDLAHAVWVKSAKSANNGGCVEVADLGDHIALRNSREPEGPVLVFTTFEWDCFVDGVDHGEFTRH